jgi:hypothetical protein
MWSTPPVHTTNREGALRVDFARLIAPADAVGSSEFDR